MMDVPYCCRDQVSEVQYHAYSQPGTYTVVVSAFDNVGNFGVAVVNVNWVTSMPEYSTLIFPLAASLIITLVGVASVKKRD